MELAKLWSLYGPGALSLPNAETLGWQREVSPTVFYDVLVGRGFHPDAPMAFSDMTHRQAFRLAHETDHDIGLVADVLNAGDPWDKPNGWSRNGRYQSFDGEVVMGERGRNQYLDSLQGIADMMDEERIPRSRIRYIQHGAKEADFVKNIRLDPTWPNHLENSGRFPPAWPRNKFGWWTHFLVELMTAGIESGLFPDAQVFAPGQTLLKKYRGKDQVNWLMATLHPREPFRRYGCWGSMHANGNTAAELREEATLWDDVVGEPWGCPETNDFELSLLEQARLLERLGCRLFATPWMFPGWTPPSKPPTSNTDCPVVFCSGFPDLDALQYAGWNTQNAADAEAASRFLGAWSGDDAPELPIEPTPPSEYPGEPKHKERRAMARAMKRTHHLLEEDLTMSSAKIANDPLFATHMADYDRRRWERENGGEG